MMVQRETPSSVKLLLIDAMKRSGEKQFPASWLSALERELRARDLPLRLAVVSIARERGLRHLDPALRELALDAEQPRSLRMACLETMAPKLSPLPPELFNFAKECLVQAGSPLEQLAAARLLATLRLGDSQLVQLARQLPAAEALIMPTLLRAFGRSTNDTVGLELVKALESAPAAHNVPPDELARTLNRFDSATRAAAQPLLARLGTDLSKQREQLEGLSGLLSGGDIGRGKQVFFGEKAACAACHRVSGQGGLLGPNLSTIAAVRTGRDLLESVIFPSASFVQGYQPLNVETREGELYTGLLVREEPGAIWLRRTDLTEVKIELARVHSMLESSVSLMPQGLDATLSREELRDLLAYLQSLTRLTSAAAER